MQPAATDTASSSESKRLAALVRGRSKSPPSRNPGPPPPAESPKQSMKNLIKLFDSSRAATPSSPSAPSQPARSKQLDSSAQNVSAPPADPPPASAPPVDPSDNSISQPSNQPSISEFMSNIKLPPFISSFILDRVIPATACVIILHIVSPRLSSAIWGLIFLILSARSNKAQKDEQNPSDTLGNSTASPFSYFAVLVNPALVLLGAVVLFSKSPSARNVRKALSKEFTLKPAKIPVSQNPNSSNPKEAEEVGVITETISVSSNPAISPIRSPVKVAAALVQSVVRDALADPVIKDAVAAPVVVPKDLPHVPESPSNEMDSESPNSKSSWWFGGKGNHSRDTSTARESTLFDPDAKSIQSFESNAVQEQTAGPSATTAKIHHLPTSASATKLNPDIKSNIKIANTTSFADPNLPEDQLTIPERRDSRLEQLNQQATKSATTPIPPEKSPALHSQRMEVAEKPPSQKPNDVSHDGSTLFADDEMAKFFPSFPLPSRANQLQLSPSITAPKPLVTPPKFDSADLFSQPFARSLVYEKMELTALPPSIPLHSNLTRLHLADNMLTALPDSTMSQLSNLQFLDISNNRISTLTKGLGSCSGLKELYARNCGIIMVEEGVLESFGELEILDLSGNNLSAFSPFAFAHSTSHLQTLILSNNRLRSLPPSLGLHRGGELVHLLINGNNFEQSIRVFTDPIITSCQSIIRRIDRDLAKKMAVLSEDAMFSHPGSATTPTGSKYDTSDRGSLYDNDSTPEAEFDYIPYRKPTNNFDGNSRIRRRSSMPDISSPIDARQNMFNRSLIKSSDRQGDPADNGSVATSYQASKNPSYVYIQRLLSHLRDVFDLSPVFHRIKNGSMDRSYSSLSRDSRSSSKQDVSSLSLDTASATTEKKNGLGDDPDAPGLTDEEREKIRKRQSPSRRAHIAAEILSTERTYVNELKTLVNLYLDPFERGILTAQDMGAMFSNLKSILYFHRSHLLPNIEHALQHPHQPLGNVFSEAAPFLKMYSMYYNNFDTANEFVIHLEKLAASGTGTIQAPLRSTILSSTSIHPGTSSTTTRRTLGKKFKNLVKIAKSSASHTQISLQSYLILPVQRLPRYKMLMDQLLEATPLTHPDRSDLEVAAVLVRDCVAECNDKKREMEEVERGWKAMGRIRAVKNRSAGVVARMQFPQQQQQPQPSRVSRHFVLESTLRVVKCVEMAPQLQDPQGGGPTDTQFAVLNVKWVAKHSVGTVTETRFSPDGLPANTSLASVGVVGQPQIGAGLDALTVYGLQRTVGREFRFLLFSDVLCWCRAISAAGPVPAASVNSIGEAEFELIRAVEVGPSTRVEKMVVITSQDSFVGGATGLPNPRFSERVQSDFGRAQRLDISGVGVKRGSGWGNFGSSNSAMTLMGPGTSGNSASMSMVGGTSFESESVLRVADSGCVLYLRGGSSDIDKWAEALKELGCEAESIE
ncbi:hypothetical protein HDU81_010842 [Chytriomyces hyalinus]|nr:hypothetical protein HDU81_010842 [Chytriomyces hyalinus]